jgi:hypothetical protein
MDWVVVIRTSFKFPEIKLWKNKSGGERKTRTTGKPRLVMYEVCEP